MNDARPAPTIFGKNSAWKPSFRRRLLAWFRRNRRQLPWRQSTDAYRVWVSEIMLQQTQVATVVPYFERFIAAFPMPTALAEAPESAVLRLWEGLGYYRRARQMHRAAQVIVERFGGEFPRNFADVLDLPGIGRYTAGAIVSIAYDEPAPILEANTVRLFSRLLAFEGDTASPAGQRLLWNFAAELPGPRGAGALNQALMELGSLVCTPRAPKCEACPVTQFCRALQTGRQREIPSPKVKASIEAVREASLVIRRGAKVLLYQRPAGERWAGLWDFPRFPVQFARGPALAEEMTARAAQGWGVQIEPGEQLATIEHSVTRFRITLECYWAAHLSGNPAPRHCQSWKWLKPAELDHYPLSVTGRKISRLLQ